MRYMDRKAGILRIGGATSALKVGWLVRGAYYWGSGKGKEYSLKDLASSWLFVILSTEVSEEGVRCYSMVHFDITLQCRLCTNQPGGSNSKCDISHTPRLPARGAGHKWHARSGMSTYRYCLDGHFASATSAVSCRV